MESPLFIFYIIQFAVVGLLIPVLGFVINRYLKRQEYIDMKLDDIVPKLEIVAMVSSKFDPYIQSQLDLKEDIRELRQAIQDLQSTILNSRLSNNQLTLK